MGGESLRDTYLDDVWTSTDGLWWEEQTTSEKWDSRRGPSSVVFDNKIWILGGANSHPGGQKNDVWSSPDGVNWTEVTSSAGWSPRSMHESLVFDNRMWVIGGYDGANSLNDIWHSQDGFSWTRVTESAEWSGRHAFGLVDYKGKLWITGGIDGPYPEASSYKHDVWVSKDPTAAGSWTQFR